MSARFYNFFYKNCSPGSIPPGLPDVASRGLERRDDVGTLRRWRGGGLADDQLGGEHFPLYATATAEPL
jgi:hypothetical protein